MEKLDFFSILLHINHGLKYSDLPLLSGVIMSIIHVVSGPDHLAAVTPLAISSKQKSWSIGMLWGLGHVLGMMILGLIFILIKDKIAIDIISGYGESLVGILLIFIGLWTLIRLRKYHGGKKGHVHPHAHGDEIHIHHHQHKHQEEHFHEHVKTHRQNLITALTIGIVHGIAGLSHLVALLPTLALPSKSGAIFYLSGFGVGTIVAMVAYAFTLGMITHKADEKQKVNLSIYLRIFGGIMAIGVGILWLVFQFS
ncbi:MAG: sulfite exporter TauE/SafE family protein [Bacteroidales bacterium]|jgi:ABC-type nickel/cobalt efflux system permease component RcnA|nr:sulfite exporter TauE/SafE family protein [Bacteroidales bacterium]